jgi:hypothetical protein
MTLIAILIDLSSINSTEYKKKYIQNTSFDDIVGLLTYKIDSLKSSDLYDYCMQQILVKYQKEKKNRSGKYNHLKDNVVSKAILWEQTKINKILNEL